MSHTKRNTGNEYKNFFFSVVTYCHKMIILVRQFNFSLIMFPVPFMFLYELLESLCFSSAVKFSVYNCL